MGGGEWVREGHCDGHVLRTPLLTPPSFELFLP